MRLDAYLVQQGKADSRTRASALIMAGHVYLNGQQASKPGAPVPENAAVVVRGAPHPYVSRGGLKLEKALAVFDVPVAGCICMDIGASSGGFTDCLLQNGAAKVYAVDVGYGQLDWKLRSDERVVSMERTNARHLKRGDVADVIDVFTVDVSFISLRHILPVMAELGSEESRAVCLVKPQFEAGREQVGKNGVVRSDEVRVQVLLDVGAYAANNGFGVMELDYSPVKGPKGNVEFLLWVQRQQQPQPLDPQCAAQAVQRAAAALDKA